MEEKKVKVGDKITAQGYTFKVKQILSYADYGENKGGIYLEFLDSDGNYHYWKQGEDGGNVIGGNVIIVKGE